VLLTRKKVGLAEELGVGLVVGSRGLLPATGQVAEGLRFL
jgi:hypothetical protein